MRNTPKAAGLGKKGFTLIELVVALAISAILGVILVSTVRTGLASYKFVDSDMMSESEARAALSLVTVQIRRHDATGAILLGSEEEDNGVIKLIDDPTLPAEEQSYSVIFFTEDGVLMAEEYAANGTLISSAAVAKLNTFTVTQDVNAFNIPVYFISLTYGENGRVLEQAVTQRSAGVPTPEPEP